jgi:predicted GH43/DUF377 family glycosyl hydrolase
MFKLKRYKKNPILKPTGLSWENKAVFNCGVCEYKKSIYLLYRAQGDDMISRFGLAKFSNPHMLVERSDKPFMLPEPNSEYETRGIEDPRITKIGETYYIVYVGASKYPNDFTPEPNDITTEWRVRIALASTQDFKVVTRHGVIIDHVDSKDAALFPEKINNQYVLIHRIIPVTKVAISEDLLRFKERGSLFGPRPGMWDSQKVGIGAPPFKTPYGWLIFYHGVDHKQVYRLGAAILGEDPTNTLARTDEPILEPIKSYEKEGLVPNVIFPCGAVETENEYLIYYGGADSVICLAIVSKSEVYKWAERECRIKKEGNDLNYEGVLPMQDNNKTSE